MKDLKKLKKESREASINEGNFAAAQFAFGSYYVAPFAIAINASNSIVAMLSAISGLLGPLSQMFSYKLIEKYPRKKIVSKAVLGEAILWLPLIVIAILFYKGILTNLLPLMALLFFAISVLSINVAMPAWFSWMGDVVEEKHRGRYFSRRNLITGFVSVITAIAASFLLEYLKTKGIVMIGFIILFTLAFLSRLISWRLFKKQYEPKIKIRKKDHFSFGDFLLSCPKTNFGKFAIYRALMGFAGTISASLVAVYLLRYIGFNYPLYMTITLAGTFISLFTLELWGKFSDKYGNYRTLAITSMMIPLIPVLWILFKSSIYLIIFPATFGGIFWAGFNLAANNFVYDNVRPEKRATAISYQNMLIGIGIFLGGGLGAILIKYLKTSFIEPIATIFILGAITRIIVVLWWVPKLKEAQNTAKYKGTKSIKKMFLKEAKPTFQHEIREIMTIGKYLHLK